MCDHEVSWNPVSSIRVYLLGFVTNFALDRMLRIWSVILFVTAMTDRIIDVLFKIRYASPVSMLRAVCYQTYEDVI